jgi:hypothetical protein
MRPSSLALLLLVPAAGTAYAAQTLRGTLIDAGGNGAQYALFFLVGPSSRLQSGSCPGGRSAGEPPTGETTCSTTFNTGFANEWQSGDVVIARAPARLQVSFPASVKPPDASSCIVAFEEWSGACSGKGRAIYTQGSTVPEYYECDITLPASGDVDIGAAFSAEDNLNRPCPVLPFEGTTTTTTTPGASTTTTTLPDLPRDPIEEIADQLTDDILLNIRRGREFYDWLRRNPVLRPALPPLPAKAVIFAEITALNTAPAGASKIAGGIPSAIAPGARGVVAKGTAKVGRSASTARVKLKATKAGRKLLRAQTLADVQLAVTLRSNAGTATRSVPVSLDE